VNYINGSEGNLNTALKNKSEQLTQQVHLSLAIRRPRYRQVSLVEFDMLGNPISGQPIAWITIPWTIEVAVVKPRCEFSRRQM